MNGDGRMQGAGLREGCTICTRDSLGTAAPPCPHACMHSGPWGFAMHLLRVQNAMLCYAMLHMMRVAGAHGSG
jgi:hypothetical protein